MSVSWQGIYGRYSVCMSYKKPRRECRSCGKEVNRVEKFYCNVSCQKDYEWSLRKAVIESTGVFPTAVNGRVPKRYLTEVYGHICVICNTQEWQGKPIPLVLDHIDGNPENWTVQNCRLICPNCDAFTPTYKGRNRGSGRFYRKQRYINGQSF